jgi:endoglucanase
MQYVTSTSFLLLAYAKYLTSARKFVNCGGITVTPKRLRVLAKRQVGSIILLSYHIYIYTHIV